MSAQGNFKAHTSSLLSNLLILLIALTCVRSAAAGPAKWTILVYMLADNNLEPFGLYDLEVSEQLQLRGSSTLQQQEASCAAGTAPVPSPGLDEHVVRPCAHVYTHTTAMLLVQEIMYAMAQERPGDCTTTACGADCPSGLVETYSVACSGGGSQRRCCSPGNYPDVLVYVDKGQGSALSQRVFDLQHADYSLLESYWTNVRTVVALPGRGTLL